MRSNPGALIGGIGAAKVHAGDAALGDGTRLTHAPNLQAGPGTTLLESS